MPLKLIWQRIARRKLQVQDATMTHCSGFEEPLQ